MAETASHPKLTNVLFDRPSNTFASFAALPSNFDAIEAGLLFSSGLSTFTAIVGPSGWGKSHLLDAIAFRYSDGDRRVAPQTLDAYLGNPSRYESARVLILDDVQDVIGKTKRCQAFRMHLERRVRAGWPTLLAFTAPKLTRTIKAVLPTQREWTTAFIDAPSPDERVQLLNRMADVEGLVLAPQLVRVLATKINGNGRTLSGALKRLRLAGPSWRSAEDTLSACGMLDAFFSDNCEWDLKLKILRAAEAHATRFWKTNPVDLSLYTMLCVDGLGEAEVARTAQVEPAEAYFRAARFRSLVAESPDVATSTRMFVEQVVGSLALD